MKQYVFVTGGSGFVGQNLILMLINQGYHVKALARSEESIQKIERLGAIVIVGDLNNANALENGVKDCTSVFHLAACVDFFASEFELKKLNVDATDLLLKIAKNSSVKKFIYLGAASVIMNGKPIIDADESFISENILDGYSKTKLLAEKSVLQANNLNFQTISIRPPLIWGMDDPNTLPAIVNAINKRQFMFIDGGNHRFVTCHVKNVCHALILAEQSKHGGKAYFITDGETPKFKDFITKLVATQAISIPEKNVSIVFVKIFAYILEFIWKKFKLNGHPPIYIGLINTLGREFIINDKKARNELGYKTIINIDQGFKQIKKYI